MRSILPSILCLMVSALPADSRPFDDLTKTPEVMVLFAELLHAGRNGLPVTESAAFIVRDATGGYHAVAWPPTGQKMRQTFRGAIPANTVAVAHTHPKGSRQPSTGDTRTAVELGLPIFVLTPLAIWVATPEGVTQPMIRSAFWPAGVGRRMPRETLQKMAMKHGAERTLLPDEVALEAVAEAPAGIEGSIVPEPSLTPWGIAPEAEVVENVPPPDEREAGEESEAA